MEPNQTLKTSAKDFFLHLGTIVALYVTTISFLNLVFKIINKIYPEVGQNIYAWGAGSEISLPVATLIIFFPLFILLSYFVYKTYAENPMKKELGIRKWLTYITLFVAGLSLAIDLVMVLYRFLDGQDLTVAFLLKALVVLLVAGAIFAHYLQDIRDRLSPKCRKMRPVVVSIIVLGAIVWSFIVMGSPQAQRLIRLDNQKITDLQNIQWQVISYWQMNGTLPEKLEDLENTQYNFAIPEDPQLNKSYEYKGVSNMTFELCADFNKEDMSNKYQYADVTGVSYPTNTKTSVIQNNNWNHKVGRQCFSRVIDPVAYPTQVRG